MKTSGQIKAPRSFSQYSQWSIFRGARFGWQSLKGFGRQLWSPQQKKRKWSQRTVLALLVVIGIFSYLTNPFVRFTIVVDPYQEIVYESGEFRIEENNDILLREGPFFSQLAKMKAGWHIVASKFTGGPKAPQGQVDEIIREIHRLRFSPEEPFLISGDHFSVLYPRSLGIFYHSILDPRTALDQEDWVNRQRIYLKTTAYALHVYKQSNQLSTTIVPVGPRSVALLNIYDLPSDTLYSLAYALAVMQEKETLSERYPFELYETSTQQDVYTLATSTASATLQATYHESLRRHWDTFFETVYDPSTGFVKKDIRLSGTKDIVHRESALYDNIMVWRTNQLLQKLGIL